MFKQYRLNVHSSRSRMIVQYDERIENDYAKIKLLQVISCTQFNVEAGQRRVIKIKRTNRSQTTSSIFRANYPEIIYDNFFSNKNLCFIREQLTKTVIESFANDCSSFMIKTIESFINFNIPVSELLTFFYY